MKLVLLAVLGLSVSVKAQTTAQISSCSAIYNNVYSTGQHTYLMVPSGAVTTNTISGVNSAPDSPYAVSIRKISSALGLIVIKLRNPATANAAYATACSPANQVWVSSMKTSWDPINGYPPNTLASLTATAVSLQATIKP